MMTFNEACKIAYNYYANQGVYGLKTSNDLGDRYSFMSNAEKIFYGDIIPITISKETGKVEAFRFFLQENIDALKNSKKMAIPDLFKHKIST